MTYRSEGPDPLVWLQGWYTAHCNGDWEHAYGVRIDTLDNPGWSVRIDLTETELEGLAFDGRKLHRTEDDWLVAWVEDNAWRAACGPLNLAEAIQQFREWSGAVPPRR